MTKEDLSNAPAVFPDAIVMPTSVAEPVPLENSDSKGSDCTEFIIMRNEKVLGVLSGPPRTAKKPDSSAHEEERKA
jgi:hypothetical protein